VPASKWMPRSYSPQKRLPPVRQTFVHSFNFYLPPPPLPLSSTSHPLWFYFLPSSCPCHSENPRMEGQRVILGVRMDTHKHFQMFGYNVLAHFVPKLSVWGAPYWRDNRGVHIRISPFLHSTITCRSHKRTTNVVTTTKIWIMIELKLLI
jgi:hypothetical protein